MDYQSVTHDRTDRFLGRLPSGRELTVPVHRYVGGSGPTAYVQAAQHGIELNGPAAIRRLDERLRGAEIAGTVVAVPVANPLAFDHRSYMTPAAYDGRNTNMNRIWPGDADGSLLERVVDRLWPLVTEAEAVVDLHTGTADMLEHVRYRADAPEAERLGEAFGTGYLLADRDESDATGNDETENNDTDEETDDNRADEETDGTLRAVATSAGVPAITAELGNSHDVSRPAIETGLSGITNVLCAVGIVADSPDSTDQVRLRDDPDPIRASESGLFERRSDVCVGERLDAGERIGRVYDPSSFELRQTVTVEEAGVAYSLSRGGAVVAGERIAALATRA